MTSYRIHSLSQLETLLKHDHKHPIKAHTSMHGIPIAIENPKGSKRHWKDPSTGEKGATVMVHPYGFIKDVEGADGDELDVFVGPHKDSDKVFIINQRRTKDLRRFDEHKVMLGFLDEEEARAAYLKNYDRKGPKILGSLRVWTLERFKRWIAKKGAKTEPVSKSGGPFIGPRGGKWADAAHTIPWRESSSWQHSKASQIHEAIRKVGHLSDHEAAEHVALVHDLLPTRAANEVARVRYDMTREQAEEAREKGKLPERLDRPAKKEEPKAVESVPAESPRAEAAKETEALEASGEYVNDRASKVEQRGEDVLGSARHRAVEWRSMREALDSEHAEEMFTRDFLMQNEPPDLISKTQEDQKRAMWCLHLHYCSKKFASKPEIVKVPKSGENAFYHWSYEGERLVRHAHTRPRETFSDAPTQEEHEKKQRAHYYQAYKIVKELIDKSATRHLDLFMKDPLSAHRSIAADLRNEIELANVRWGHNDAGTGAIIDTYNAWVGRGKMSPLGQSNAAAGRIRFANTANGKEELSATAQRVALAVMEGKSLNSALGEKGAKKGHTVELSTMYDTSVMTRKGPASEFKSVKQGLDMLDKSAGGKFEMRGVQWGKSVTDEEREHHLKSLVDSFNDLTGILGLPAEMSSFNGKLAIAVGARGKAGALAHYEGNEKVINLTRASGAGSLAHEWGHFFDHTLCRVSGMGASAGPRSKVLGGFWNLTVASEAVYSHVRTNPNPHPTLKAMHSLVTSDTWKQFRLRVGRVAQEQGMSDKEHAYWTSTAEVFARCFERHIQGKLHASGRENTYLVGLHKAASDPNGLWPTNEEQKALEPLFDSLFESFRNSDLLKKALRFIVRRR
jgi:hypothetical protein